MATLTLHGFNFFEYLFKTINVELKRFEPATDRMTPGRDFVVCTFDIVGIDLLWRICLEAHNTEVSQLAIDLLNRLYKSVCLISLPFAKFHRVSPKYSREKRVVLTLDTT